jgi:hypothetical protein
MMHGNMNIKLSRMFKNPLMACINYNIRARTGVLMEVLLKIQVSCDVTQCRMVITDVSEERSAFMSGSS